MRHAASKLAEAGIVASALAATLLDEAEGNGDTCRVLADVQGARRH